MKNSKPRRRKSSNQGSFNKRQGKPFYKKSNNNRSRNNNRNRFKGDKIDVKMFINKAEPAEQAEVFVPEYSFDDLKINKKIKQAIASRGFKSPTPIQEKAIPAVLRGGDVIGLANTGTGKTATFLIPLIHKILTNPQEKVLIMVPVRELAIQIEQELKEFTKKIDISSLVVVGGANIGRQIVGLRRKPNIVIGTPGRLKDLFDRKKLDLSKFNNVVLDEADRMLDMGFINDMRLLLSKVAEKRQTLFFSATFSPAIEKLVEQFLDNPTKISIKTRETSKQVDQDVVRVRSHEDKFDVFHDTLRKTEFEKVLVFSRTKHGADKLSKLLRKKGFRSESIHGNKTHNKRQRALKMFKENIVDVLVATDVAARGLDIPNVSHVINFDVPATYDDYVHRIGRTGRADKTGTALTFIN
ncbi:DEAD/DEAH box helicase [Patescibacteria group bacterium]